MSFKQIIAGAAEHRTTTTKTRTVTCRLYVQLVYTKRRRKKSRIELGDNTIVDHDPPQFGM